MVAKVEGFGRFVSLANEFGHRDWDDMAKSLEQIAADLAAGRELAKENIANARKAVDQLNAFNAAFGNGPPSAGSAQSSQAGEGSSNPQKPAA